MRPAALPFKSSTAQTTADATFFSCILTARIVVVLNLQSFLCSFYIVDPLGRLFVDGWPIDLRCVAESAASLQTTAARRETVGGAARRQGRRRIHQRPRFPLQGTQHGTAQRFADADVDCAGGLQPRPLWRHGRPLAGQCIQQHPCHGSRQWPGLQGVRRGNLRHPARVIGNRIANVTSDRRDRHRPKATRG